jgi:hypothetical protein
LVVMPEIFSPASSTVVVKNAILTLRRPQSAAGRI